MLAPRSEATAALGTLAEAVVTQILTISIF
jgi:hypothetical protein